MPCRRTAGRSGQAEDAGARGDRARQHVLVRGVPRPRACARTETDPRMRSLRRIGQPIRKDRPAERDEPPRAACGDDAGLQEPHQAGVCRLHRGLLLSTPHRQGSARTALSGVDRAQQLPQGRSRQRSESGAGASSARSGGAAARHSRTRQLLSRDAVPRHRGATGRQPRHRAAGA